jgi:CHAT domain-containing protein
LLDSSQSRSWQPSRWYPRAQIAGRRGEPARGRRVAPAAGSGDVNGAARWAVGAVLPLAMASLACEREPRPPEIRSAADLPAAMAWALGDLCRFESSFSGGLGGCDCAPAEDSSALIPRPECEPPPEAGTRAFERLSGLRRELAEHADTAAPAALRAQALWKLVWSDSASAAADAVALLHSGAEMLSGTRDAADYDLESALVELAIRSEDPTPAVAALDRIASRESEAPPELLRRIEVMLRLRDPTGVAIEEREEAGFARALRGLAPMPGESARVHLALAPLASATVVPELARDVAFRELIPRLVEWSREGAPTAELKRIREALRVVADAVAAQTGDVSLVDALSDLADPSADCGERLTAGHLRLASGMRSFDRLEVERALPELKEAEEWLSCGRAAAIWARLWAAGARMYVSDKDAAGEEFERLATDALRLGYPAVAARATWGQGTATLLANRPEEARALFERALELFVRLREPRNAGAVAGLLDETLDHLGLTSAGWRVRLLELSFLRAAGDAVWLSAAWVQASRAATRDGFPFAADRFALAGIDAAERTPDLVGRAAAYLEAARVAIRQKRQGDAAARLLRARRVVEMLKSGSLRERLLAEIGMHVAEASVAATADEGKARSELLNAYQIFSRQGNLLEASMATRILGELAERQRDFPAALDWYVRSGRLLISSASRRATSSPAPFGWLETNATVLDGLMRLPEQTSGSDAVLALLEDTGGELRLAGLPSVSDASPEQIRRALEHRLRRSLRSGECALRIFTASSATAIWLADSNGLESLRRPLGREALGQRVDRMLEALFVGGLGGEEMAQLAELSRELFGPAANRLAQCKRAAIVANAPLARLPFAALPVGRQGAAWIEGAELRLVPTLAHVAAGQGSAAADDEGADRQRVVMVVDGSGRLADTDSELPSARGEVADVCGLYPECSVVHWDDGRLHHRVRPGERLVVHVIGHGTASRTPLVLASITAGLSWGSGESELWDEVARFLPLAPEVVFLSACDTGSARFGRWAGSLSPGRRRLEESVPESILTLWPIEDRKGREMSARVHKGLAAGRSAAASLREVQLEFLAESGEAYGARVSSWLAYVAVEGGAPSDQPR